jgi:hypothetical protein
LYAIRTPDVSNSSWWLDVNTINLSKSKLSDKAVIICLRLIWVYLGDRLNLERRVPDQGGGGYGGREGLAVRTPVFLDLAIIFSPWRLQTIKMSKWIVSQFWIATSWPPSLNFLQFLLYEYPYFRLKQFNKLIFIII